MSASIEVSDYVEIGNYELANKNSVSGDTGAARDNTLYQNIKGYQSKHAEKIAKFQQKYPGSTPATPGDEKYFRQAFYDYIQSLPKDSQHSQYQNPIEMAALFGEKFTELYELALEEEMNSTEYMDAVLDRSTKSYEGAKWQERPVVFVGGPSASGKTFAAKAAITKASEFLKKDENNIVNNEVIFVDGGVAREVSQIRKLAIKAANNRGYSGIKDLNGHSQVLRKVKRRIYSHALQDKERGMVLPETFSAFIVPGDKSKKMLKDATKLENAKVIFTRTEGKNPSRFQKVVQYMGASRAWATGKIATQDTKDLNAKIKSESKKYGKGGFKPGVAGSKQAENWFKENFKENLSMIITNDLVLKKPDPNNKNSYIDAEPNDAGVIMVTERLYNHWLNLSEPKETLANFNKHVIELSEQKNLNAEEKELVKLVDSLIQTSAEVKLNIAKEKLAELIKSDPSKRETLQPIIKAMANESLRDESQRAHLQAMINEAKSKYSNSTLGIQRSSTYQVLDTIDSSLGVFAQELLANKNAPLTTKADEMLTSKAYIPDNFSLVASGGGVIDNLNNNNIDEISQFIQKNNANPLLYSSMNEMQYINKLTLIDPIFNNFEDFNEMLKGNNISDIHLSFSETGDKREQFYRNGFFKNLANMPISTLTLSGALGKNDIQFYVEKMAASGEQKTLTLKNQPDLQYAALKALTDKHQNITIKADGFVGLRLGIDRLIQSAGKFFSNLLSGKKADSGTMQPAAEKPVQKTAFVKGSMSTIATTLSHSRSNAMDSLAAHKINAQTLSSAEMSPQADLAATHKTPDPVPEKKEEVDHVEEERHSSSMNITLR